MCIRLQYEQGLPAAQAMDRLRISTAPHRVMRIRLHYKQVPVAAQAMDCPRLLIAHHRFPNIH